MSDCGACVLIKGGCAHTCLHGVSVPSAVLGGLSLYSNCVFTAVLILDQASEEKKRLEEKQRAARKNRSQSEEDWKTRCAEGLGRVGAVGGPLRPASCPQA